MDRFLHALTGSLAVFDNNLNRSDCFAGLTFNVDIG